MPTKLPGETLCKLFQIFPPKVLVYIWKIFLDTSLNLEQIKYLLIETLVHCWLNIVKDNKDYTYWKYFIFVNNKYKTTEIKVYWQVNNNTTIKKKIRRMRIFEHRIFSKFFGGKICHIWTEITYLGFLKKLAHAYFKRPYFSKFFGGKIENF